MYSSPSEISGVVAGQTDHIWEIEEMLITVWFLFRQLNLCRLPKLTLILKEMNMPRVIRFDIGADHAGARYKILF
jgi:hypothetical protein